MLFNKNNINDEIKMFKYTFIKIKILTKLKILEWEFFSNKNSSKTEDIILKTKNKILIDNQEFFIYFHRFFIFDDPHIKFIITKNFKEYPYYYLLISSVIEPKIYEKLNNFFNCLKDKITEKIIYDKEKHIKILNIKKFKVLK